MSKTPLEIEFDEAILEFLQKSITDNGVESLIEELGDDVLSLEKQDLLRLLAKAVFNIHIMMDERINLEFETYKALQNFSSGKEVAAHSLNEYTKTEVSELITNIKEIVGVKIAEFGETATKQIKSDLARKGAYALLAKDPRQTEKIFVFECWQKWQRKPDNYKSKAKFGKDMLEKCEHLTSQKKIEDWCREWEKANPAG